MGGFSDTSGPYHREKNQYIREQMRVHTRHRFI
jgi:hypothetical protein